jgi:hypothetical protein
MLLIDAMEEAHPTFAGSHSIFRPPTATQVPPLYLHHRFIAGDLVTLCPGCHRALFKSKKLPEFSIANDHDYGNPPPGLRPPTLAEILVIARARMFVGMVKVSAVGGVGGSGGDKLRGHIIVFPMMHLR